jgi:Spy/CpxP family protein refolding chaperone
MLRPFLSPFILLMLAFATFGQNGPPPDQPQRFDGPPPEDRRPNPLDQLGLSKDQMQQLRRANQEHRPLMQAAQQRMREANRELDMAIYADTVSDEIFRTKLQAFQEAQREVNRLRFLNELNIRKVLTPEQLVRFRDMRRKFAEANERMQQQRRQNPANGDRPGDRLRQQLNNKQNNPPVRQVNRQTKPTI